VDSHGVSMQTLAFSEYFEKTGKNPRCWLNLA